MACSATERGNDGLATPAATLICLAITTVATATLLLSASQLKLAKSKLARGRISYALEGAHVSARSTVIYAKPERLSWRINSPLGEIYMLAEPEWIKAGPGTTEEKLLASLPEGGDFSAAHFISGLAGWPRRKTISSSQLRALDSTPFWRACGRSLASPWGSMSPSPLLRSKTPGDGERSPPGQTWRIVASLQGRADDRTETLTGDPDNPVVLRERSVEKLAMGAPACDDLLDTPRMQMPRGAIP